MNNITAFGHKFFIFGGIVLIAVAVAQVLARPRGKGRVSALGLLDATALRAILFVAMGILAILAGAGVIPMGGGR
jgi:hypothetical protein